MHLKVLIVAGVFSILCIQKAQAQADTNLLDLIDNTKPVTNYTNAIFKTTRIINSQSLETDGKGVLDMKIDHRFGALNTGGYNLWGLDAATNRLGLDYGITNQLTVGLGRSSYEKTYDGFVKYKFLRQSTGAKVMPISAVAVFDCALKTVHFQNPDRKNYFTSRLYYTWQLLIGRKFSEGLSLQIMPTLVHRNLVETPGLPNDVYAIGFGGRQKLTSRVAINAEYYYVLPGQLASTYHNSLSAGIDIETGGHVFSLHFTNSTSMVENGFVTETTGTWGMGDIHFGFNISRVFQLDQKQEKPVPPVK